HAQARRRGQRQRQQGADQITDVVPGGQRRALLQGQQAVLEQVGQQGGVGEAAQGVDNDQGGAAGEQGEKDLTGGGDGHFLIVPGTTTSANLAGLRSRPVVAKRRPRATGAGRGPDQAPPPRRAPATRKRPISSVRCSIWWLISAEASTVWRAARALCWATSA